MRCHRTAILATLLCFVVAAPSGSEEPGTVTMATVDEAMAEWFDGSHWKLKEAVREGNTETCAALLDQLDAESAEYRAALNAGLVAAVQTIDVELTTLFLQLGGDPDARDDLGNTLLHIGCDAWMMAVDEDRPARRLVVTQLLAAGADVGIAGGPINSTPLHDAAYLGDPVILRMLLDAGADPDASDDHGETALHKASSAGNADCARLLLRAGADVNARSGRGVTPIIESASHGDTTTTRILIENCAVLDTLDDDGRSVLNSIWFAQPMVKRIGANTGLVRLLIEAGGPVHTDPAILRIGALNTEVLEILIDQGVIVAADVGAELMQVAARRANREMVLTLLKAGVDVDARATDGPTPLMIAAWRGDHQTAWALLAAGADAGAIGEGLTAADIARRAGAFELADELWLHQDGCRRDDAERRETERAPEDMIADAGQAEIDSLRARRDEAQRQFESCVASELETPDDTDDRDIDPLMQWELDREKEFLAEYGYPAFCDSEKKAAERMRVRIEDLRSRPWNDTEEIALDHDAAYIAIEYGGEAVLECLLRAGLQLDSADARGESLLELAVREGDVESVAAILDAGAHIEADTPLLEASAQVGPPGVVRMLLDAGAGYQSAVDECGRAEKNAYHLWTLWESIPLARALMQHGNTPNCGTLFESINSGSPALVREILIAVGDVDCISEMGRLTPLFFAVTSTGEPEIVKALLEAGADPDAPGYNGWRPIMQAAAYDQRTNLELLLAAGASPNGSNVGGETPLHLASHQGYLWMIDRLLTAGADMNAPDVTGRTPLMYAVASGGVDAVQLLLDRGADVSVRDAAGLTALDLARELTRHGFVPAIDDTP